MRGLTGYWGMRFLLPLPDGVKKGGPASAPNSLRKRAIDRDKHCSRPTPSQQLGFREGVPNSLRLPRSSLLCGRFSSLLRGKETRKKSLDELFGHRRAHHPDALPEFVQRLEGEIFQGTRDQARSYYSGGLSPVLDRQTHNYEALGSGRTRPA